MKSIILWFIRRWPVFLSLAVVTPLGFACKGYFCPVNRWFYLYGGGVLYEVFFCLITFLFWYDRRHITRIAVWVCIVTCSLEFLQLWKAEFLLEIRRTFLGKTLLGTTFVWWDMPHYLVGCAIGWLVMAAICKLFHRPLKRAITNY